MKNRFSIINAHCTQIAAYTSHETERERERVHKICLFINSKSIILNMRWGIVSAVAITFTLSLLKLLSIFPWVTKSVKIICLNCMNENMDIVWAVCVCVWGGKNELFLFFSHSLLVALKFSFFTPQNPRGCCCCCFYELSTR